MPPDGGVLTLDRLSRARGACQRHRYMGMEGTYDHKSKRHTSGGTTSGHPLRKLVMVEILDVAFTDLSKKHENIFDKKGVALTSSVRCPWSLAVSRKMGITLLLLSSMSDTALLHSKAKLSKSSEYSLPAGPKTSTTVTEV